MVSYSIVYDNLRKLANTSYYQTLYMRDDLQVFTINTDLSDIQITFLSLLGFYHSLSMEVSFGEVEDKVYEDFIYEDAYMYYKFNKDKKRNMQLHSDNDGRRFEPNKLRDRGLRKDKVTKEKSQWIFK